MNRAEFSCSLSSSEPPHGISGLHLALWHLERGDWEAAHKHAQHHREGALLHAHLHRVEGDVENAAYWYSKAGSPFPKISLEEEREQLLCKFFP